jgi:hypothetical protein
MSPHPSQPSPTRAPLCIARAAMAMTLLAVPWTIARADGGAPMPRQVPAAYAQECGSCHIAYAPGLLPKASWQRLMGGLNKHFGSDASVDAATVATLGAWLQTHGGTGRRVGEAPPEDRITRSAWFERKHRKIDAAVWQLPSVGSAAQCGACHTGADTGDFDDDRLKMPAGLSLRQRWSWGD